MNMIQHIVAEINAQTGESECRYYKERLLYLEDNQRDLLIDSSRILTCHGDLKNNRGAVSYSLSLSLSHTQTLTDTHRHTQTHTDTDTDTDTGTDTERGGSNGGVSAATTYIK